MQGAAFRSEKEAECGRQGNGRSSGAQFSFGAFLAAAFDRVCRLCHLETVGSRRTQAHTDIETSCGEVLHTLHQQHQS